LRILKNQAGHEKLTDFEKSGGHEKFADFEKRSSKTSATDMGRELRNGD
jgi:hypothetical protein